MNEQAPILQFSAPVIHFPIIVGLVIGAGILLIVMAITYWLDRTGGPLTITVIILVLFTAVTISSVMYVIPQDETTGSVIGALTLAVGAIITYWFTKH